MLNQSLNWSYLLTCCFALLLAAYFYQGIPYGEELYLLNAFRIAPWNEIGRTITHFGEWYVWVCVIVYLFVKQRKSAFILTIASFGVTALSFGLKELADQPRPGAWVQQQQQQQPDRTLIYVPNEFVPMANTSFPSGHTISAFAIFFIIAQLPARKWSLIVGITSALMATCIGGTRVFLVQHFLIDVMAGCAIGLICGYVIWQAVCKWSNPS
jgi:membrane-associated phospholipid phosphatase